jgi:hypothetical protein
MALTWAHLQSHHVFAEFFIGGSMYRLAQGCFVLSLALALASAAAPPIGVARSAGHILLNSASVPGNATVFEGSTLGSDKDAVVNVRLNNGSQVQFKLTSSGKMYRDHVDLINGTAQITGYSATANGLKVSAEGNSSAAISLQGKAIQVADLSGDVHVFNAQGISVANLIPGRVMRFQPDPQGVGGGTPSGASATSTLQGCAIKKGNDILLTDKTSNVSVQLRGGNVNAGRQVRVSGTTVPNATPPVGASQVLNVTNVTDLGACDHTKLSLLLGGGAATIVGVIAAVLAEGASTSPGKSSVAGPGPVVTAPGSPGTVSGGFGSTSYTVTDQYGNVFTVTITPTVAAAGSSCPSNGCAPQVSVQLTTPSPTASPTVLAAASNQMNLQNIATSVQTYIANNPTAAANPANVATAVSTAVTSSTGAQVPTAPTCISPCNAV